MRFTDSIPSALTGTHAVSPDRFSASWTSPSNIALVKYWGKSGDQLPMNPSLSMTLSQAVSRTQVIAKPRHSAGLITAVNDDPHHPFIPKMQHLVQRISGVIPVLGHFDFRVGTVNSFPHSTGIASSASGLSAFALCLLDIACKAAAISLPAPEFLRLASFFSRLGSGSACRSVYGGYTVWGETELIQGTSDEFAVPLEDPIDPLFSDLRDSILVVSSKPKSLSSTLGHHLMTDHPWREGRIRQAHLNLGRTIGALRTGDFETLAAVAEEEALALHALIMSASGGTLLIEPGTLEIIRLVREERQHGMPWFFTLDAGANVHLLFPASVAADAGELIRQKLACYCEEGKVISDSCGSGPSRTETAAT